MGLNEALERSCNVLSGGERTKLSLAVLFSTKANMLILDEPTNFLDIKTFINVRGPVLVNLAFGGWSRYYFEVDL